jgi:hypothetical protein
VLKQASKEGDITARRRQSIDHRIIDDDDAQGVWLAGQRHSQGRQEFIEEVEALWIYTLLLTRSELGHDLTPQPLFPGNRNVGGHQRAYDRDAPEVQGCHDAESTHGRDASA